MDRSSPKTAAGGIAALALIVAMIGATAVPANASYLGYGNGDPGAWDFWTEQAGGPVVHIKAGAGRVHHAHAYHHLHSTQKKHTG